MRIACLNQDRGISPARKKGAAIHLEAMRAAFRKLGADVIEVDEDDEVRAERVLEELHAACPLDLVYERYALGRVAGARFARRRGVPLVLEVNAPLAEEARRYRGMSTATDETAADAFVFAAAARVIAVSEPVAQYAIECGASAEVVRVHPNGVDTDRFRPRDDDELRRRLVPADRFVVGFHGRLRPWHGIELLVDALVGLEEQGLPVHFLFVGEGDVAAVLGDRWPAARFTHIPWVLHAEVGQYVATFDALPLTYAREAPCYFSPLKLAEAMACGVVPVYPPLGDLDRVLRDGENAVAYTPGDARSLAGALRDLAADPERRARLASAAVAAAREMGWERIAASALEGLAPRPEARP